MSNQTPDNNADSGDADTSASAIGADISAELAELLGDEAMWEPSDPSDELAIMDAISELMLADAAAPDTAPTSEQTTDTGAGLRVVAGSAGGENARSISSTPDVQSGNGESNVVALSSARRWVAPFAAGIAAALALVVGISAFTGEAQRESIELALTATDLAPEAEAVVEISETANGTVLVLDVSGLPPAPEGSYYEAWVRQDAEVGVSAGTFHLRGGGGEIELWAGVSTEEYPLVTITIQDEAQAVSSGEVVLRGLIEG